MAAGVSDPARRTGPWWRPSFLRSPPELPAPSGFSHAVVGSGRVVFLAGQTALDESGAIVGDGIVEQFE